MRSALMQFRLAKIDGVWRGEFSDSTSIRGELDTYDCISLVLPTPLSPTKTHLISLALGLGRNLFPNFRKNALVEVVVVVVVIVS